MMIIVLLGTSRVQQQAITNVLIDELKDFSVRIVDNDPEKNNIDTKHRNLSSVILGRNYRDTVTVVTGVNSLHEFEMLDRARAVFCILPGTLPGFLCSGAVNITKDFLYVALAPEKLATMEKRRVYISPLEAFSECYLRERQSLQRGGR